MKKRYIQIPLDEEPTPRPAAAAVSRLHWARCPAQEIPGFYIYYGVCVDGAWADGAISGDQVSRDCPSQKSARRWMETHQKELDGWAQITIVRRYALTDEEYDPLIHTVNEAETPSFVVECWRDQELYEEFGWDIRQEPGPDPYETCPICLKDLRNGECLFCEDADEVAA